MIKYKNMIRNHIHRSQQPLLTQLKLTYCKIHSYGDYTNKPHPIRPEVKLHVCVFLLMLCSIL